MNTVSPHLAAVSFRINMAGEATEHVVSLLMASPPRMFQARLKLQEAVKDLEHCVKYLTVAGTKYEPLLQYVQELIKFYNAQMQQVLRPAGATKIAAAIYDNQGNLIAANPFIGVMSEKFRQLSGQI